MFIYHLHFTTLKFCSSPSFSSSLSLFPFPFFPAFSPFYSLSHPFSPFPLPIFPLHFSRVDNSLTPSYPTAKFKVDTFFNFLNKIMKSYMY